jgi:hypothetical protein
VSELGDRIVDALRDQGDVDEDDLADLLGMDWREPGWREVHETLRRLVDEGVVGSSYYHGEIVPGYGTVGRIYFVWLRTPETAELDRRRLWLDTAWAAATGGIFSRDRDLLHTEEIGKGFVVHIDDQLRAEMREDEEMADAIHQLLDTMRRLSSGDGDGDAPDPLDEDVPPW